MRAQQPWTEHAASFAGSALSNWSLARRHIVWLLMLGDLALVNLCALAALWLGIQRSSWWLAVARWDAFALWFCFLTALWFIFAQVVDLYDLQIAGLPRRAIGRVILVVLSTLGVYLVIYFVADPKTLPRHLIVSFAVIAGCVLAAWRGAFALALGSGPLARRVVVIGSPADLELWQTVREYAPRYYRTLAAFDPSSGEKLDELTHFKAGAVDEVVLADSNILKPDWLAAIVALRERGVQITELSSLYEDLTGRVPLALVSHSLIGLLSRDTDVVRGLNDLLKRALDLGLAGLGLVISLLLAPVVALAVRLDSPGPLLLRQARVGRGGKVYSLYKVRTMFSGAETEGEAQWSRENDPRVTRVGRLLRRFKLDEAPQFWNVLRGEMSLVGPRPERPELVAQLENEIPLYRLRHIGRPGMTGWAAVRFRYGRSVDDAMVKLEYDLYYLKHQSLLLDLLVLAKTVGAIIRPPR